MNVLSKRVLSFLMVMAIVFTMTPAQVFATEVEDHDHAVTESATEQSNPAVAEFQADIDEMLNWYLGTTSMSRDQIEAAVAQMDSDTVWMAQVEIIDLEAAMVEELTEAECVALAEANPVFCDFADVVSATAAGPNLLAGNLTVTDANLGLSWTDASNSNGKASWTASGTTVTGTATGYKGGFLNLSSYTVTTTLTITNNHGENRTLSFDFTLSGGGSVSGLISGTSGSYSAELAAGASATITLTSPKGTSTNTLTLSGLQLLSSGAVESTFLVPENGSYTVDGTAITVQTTFSKPATESYALVATPATGYAFFGWYSEASGSYLSYDASVSLKLAADPQLKPIFVSADMALFGVGSARFTDLTEAATFAASGSNKTVVLLNNGTVRGSHTIPAGVTLLIPYNSSNTAYGSKPNCTSENNEGTLGLTDTNYAWVQPTAYRTLTLASGASITVSGAMEVSGQHAASNGGKPYCGSPTGPLGWVKMQSGSSITLNSGANLYCWGYIQGSGTITAKSGAKVYENFQFTDFRGGNNTTNLTNAKPPLVFPINQYYVQNIEVATTYESGAEEYVATSVYMNSMCQSATVKFMGSGGMFVPAAGATITKDYIENRDRLYVDISGNASLNSLTMTLSGVTVNSATYVLPITNNITIKLNSGTTIVNQGVALLPGAELIIDENAVLDISHTDTALNDYNNYCHALIAYDRDEWMLGYFAFSNAGNKHMRPVGYAPGRTYTRTEADLKDAVIDVNGTIRANGYLYTTTGGAAIKSTGKTGKIVMVNGAGQDLVTFQSPSNAEATVNIPMTSAKLMNGDGTYLATAEYDDVGSFVSGAAAGDTFYYCATCDAWIKGITVTFDANGGSGSMNAQLLENPCCETLTANAYSNGAKIFNGWNTAADGSGTAYSDGSLFAGTENTTLYAQWKNAVEYTANWIVEGETVETGTAVPGEVPEYKGATPTKASNGHTDYTFSHWVDGSGTQLTADYQVTGDVNFTAVFTESTSACSDKTGDGNHTCDICGKTGITNCSAGAAVRENEVAPSCYEAGSYDEVTYCTECGEELSRETKTVDAIGHDMKETSSKVEATCETAGKEAIFTCANGCGKTEGGDVITALGHDMQKSADQVDATCEKDGTTEVYTCANGCGKTEGGETIPATGKHVDSDPADNVCDTCDKVLVDPLASMTAALNEDYSKINIQIENAYGYEKVYVEVVNDKGVFSLECEADGDGQWVATANLCDYVVAGMYTIHAYGENSDGTTALDQASVEVILPVNHSYSGADDKTCDICGKETRGDADEEMPSVPMFRMYNPNSGEHFYTGSEEERDILVSVGWNYEGVGFNAPVEGEPVYRLYEPVTGEHLYTMDRVEVHKLLASGWNYENVAWNSAGHDEVVQYRLRNPNATIGRYHFTSSLEERDWLIGLGWIYEGYGWYSCLK